MYIYRYRYIHIHIHTCLSIYLSIYLSYICYICISPRHERRRRAHQNEWQRCRTCPNKGGSNPPGRQRGRWAHQYAAAWTWPGPSPPPAEGSTASHTPRPSPQCRDQASLGRAAAPIYMHIYLYIHTCIYRYIIYRYRYIYISIYLHISISTDIQIHIYISSITWTRCRTFPPYTCSGKSSIVYVLPPPLPSKAGRSTSSNMLSEPPPALRLR